MPVDAGYENLARALARRHRCNENVGSLRASVVHTNVTSLSSLPSISPPAVVE
jgi:hypothetical protein